MALQEVDLEFYDSLPSKDKEEWLTSRTACDASLFYFIKECGGFSIKAGGEIIEELYKPICAFLQDHNIKRKGFYAPRNWLKSTVGSKMGNMWRYFQDNEIRILIPSQKIDLPVSFIKFIKAQAIRNSRMRWLYPILHHITPAWRHSNSWGSAECEFPRIGGTPEPTFRAIGLTGGAQGGHFEVVGPDDIVSEKGMESKPALEDAYRWIDNVEELLDVPEAENPDGGEIVFYGTHWGPGDPGVYIQSEYREYKWMIVPCLKDTGLKDTENITYIQNPDVHNGESNWPSRVSTSFYIDMKANPQKQAVFWAQHMNIPSGADVMTSFDIKWYRYYRFENRDGQTHIICKDDGEEFRVGSFPLYGFIDPGGFSEKRLTKSSSRFAVMVGGQPMGTHKKFITYAHAFRFKEPDKALDEVFKAHSFLAPITPSVWRQEVYGQQRYILNDVRREAQRRRIPLRIVELEADENKDSKALSIDALKAPLFNGEIYIHESMRDLISETRDYPGGMTQDLLDLAGQLFKTYLKRDKRTAPPQPSSKTAWGGASHTRTNY